MAELRQTLKIITEHGHSFETPTTKLPGLETCGTCWDILGPVGTRLIEISFFSTHKKITPKCLFFIEQI